MDQQVADALWKRVDQEPFARKLGLKLVKLEPGYALVEMTLQPDTANIFETAHGGAIFSLIDEAFELSCNSHGTVAVALSVTVTYHRPPKQGAILRAESREIHRSRSTGTYDIKVTENEDVLIASCQAVAYRKNEKLPFI